MTLFIEVGEIRSILAEAGVDPMDVFSKPVKSVTGFEMMILNKTVESKLGRKHGRCVMKRIVTELARAQILGLVDPCPATEYQLPVPKLTLGEFRTILMKFTIEERRLIVFALATGKNLTECSFLQHKEIKKEANINNWSGELRRFIAGIPRHITCPFVFWELDNKKCATAMVGFDARFRSVTKASWQVFADLCSNLIPVDTHEDAKEFATMFVLESANH